MLLGYAKTVMFDYFFYLFRTNFIMSMISMIINTIKSRIAIGIVIINSHPIAPHAQFPSWHGSLVTSSVIHAPTMLIIIGLTAKNAMRIRITGTLM